MNLWLQLRKVTRSWFRKALASLQCKNTRDPKSFAQQRMLCWCYKWWNNLPSFLFRQARLASCKRRIPIWKPKASMITSTSEGQAVWAACIALPFDWEGNLHESLPSQCKVFSDLISIFCHWFGLPHQWFAFSIPCVNAFGHLNKASRWSRSPAGRIESKTTWVLGSMSKRVIVISIILRAWSEVHDLRFEHLLLAASSHVTLACTSRLETPICATMLSWLSMVLAQASIQEIRRRD